jgi:pyruvate/2-oxoacid:ferredoxin oxidoreductase beta subunit
LSIAYPENVAQKIATALSIREFRFLLMHSPCPTGWKSEPEDSIELVLLEFAILLFFWKESQ